MTETDREIRSGWWRSVVLAAVGVVSLAASTYTVVARVTEYQLKVERLVEEVADNKTDIQNLRTIVDQSSQLRAEQKGILSAVLSSLEEIKRRLERIENGRYNGTQH